MHSKLAAFHAKLPSEFHHCTCCNESFPSLKVSFLCVCSKCSCDTSEPKLYSDGNNMDPGPVPPALQELTQVEEMLVSPVMPMMSVYRLPHGQIGYGGHVINLPQDVPLPSFPAIPVALILWSSERKALQEHTRIFRLGGLTCYHRKKCHEPKLGTTLGKCKFPLREDPIVGILDPIPILGNCNYWIFIGSALFQCQDSVLSQHWEH